MAGVIRLKVCRTCDRDAANPGVSGAALAAAVAREMPANVAQHLSLLTVECLSGCRQPAQAMVSGNGPPVRFSGLTAADAGAVIAAALAYAGLGPCGVLSAPGAD